jgi:hypothetical protein
MIRCRREKIDYFDNIWNKLDLLSIIMILISTFYDVTITLNEAKIKNIYLL